MSMIFAELLTFARKVVDEAVDATTVTEHWTDTTHCRFTVPSGKRWLLIGGIVYRANNTSVVGSGTSGTVVMYYVSSLAAGTGFSQYPDTDKQNLRYVLDPADYLEFVFGGAQGATSWVSISVLEVDV